MVLNDGTMISDDEKVALANICRDYVRGCCMRENCRYTHEKPPLNRLKELFRFCHDYQNKGCFRHNCKFMHFTLEEEAHFYSTGNFPQDPRERGIIPVCQAYLHGSCSNPECNLIHPLHPSTNDHHPELNMPLPHFNRPPHMLRDEDSPPECKVRRYTYEDVAIENQIPVPNLCQNCDSLDHKVKLLHDNISVLLKKVADLTEKNVQLTSMNEFLLEQAAANRGEQSCIITSRHGTSAPVSLATVSMTPVVSLSGALPALVPAAATPNIALAPAASRAQLLTPAPQLLTVSTTQQLMGNSGALIVTSAGAQQLMQVSDSGTLMGGGQTVVAVTPAQLTLAPPPQQLMGNASQTTVQQLVQQTALPQQLAAQQQQFTAQQSVQHLAAAQQNAQHLAAQQSAQQLAAAQQSAQQQLAAEQSAHLLAAQQSQQLAQQSAQQLAAQQVPSAQQLVHQTSTQQITISSTSQPMALSNSQNQPLTFPIISQSILPH
ncbi:zinc finger CCCH domain-containing protein 10-like [Leguminivora glycinivorella]|uniref:zinc finger CCCH domain-containing protein 10-like n=1 Tax=Leguminivora glycinivorella TaxID=1035111 RepID=UPI00200D2CE4|nr:zinc finger CCCH domain-containing protein 10-like [Leguminivora glycinivorella]